MSQMPGDMGSKFLAGTLGGPGYGEFPLGSAGPRVDPRDPRYIPPPQPGSGVGQLLVGVLQFTSMDGQGRARGATWIYQGTRVFQVASKSESQQQVTSQVPDG